MSDKRSYISDRWTGMRVAALVTVLCSIARRRGYTVEDVTTKLHDEWTRQEDLTCRR